MAKRFHSGMKVRESFGSNSNLPEEIIRQDLGHNHSMMTGVNDLYSEVQSQIKEDNADLGKYKTDRKY
jgi:hypothetical protein